MLADQIDRRDERLRLDREQPRRARGTYRTPPEQWIRFAVPAIVDAELFEAVAEQMKENRKRLRSRIPKP